MLRLLALLVAILALAAGVATQPTTAEEPLDISGEWKLEDLPFTEVVCVMTIAQAGTLLAATDECFRWHLTGEIDLETGLFNLTGDRIFSFEGTASNDSLLMELAADSPLGHAEIVGTRAVITTERTNASGTWRSILTGAEQPERCDTSVWHRNEDLEITVVCGGEAIGTFAGTTSMATGSFLLTGKLRGSEGILEGVFSASGRTFSAIWSVPDIGQGALTGHLEQRTGGVLAVDCDGATEGIQTSCEYDTGTTFAVQLHMAEVPPVAFTSFEISFLWTAPQFAYRQAELVEEEFVVEDCAIAKRGNGWVRPVHPHPVVGFICLNLEAPPGPFEASVYVEVVMSCWAEGSGILDFGLVTLWGDGLEADPRDGIIPETHDATVSCRPHIGPLGDIDCSGDVDSKDAMIVLQMEAGMVDGPACDFKGDMTQEGRIDSLDAILILQVNAGLIPRLPVL